MDYEVLEQMLKTPARYVGCIGSAKKLDATKRRLVAAGVPEVAFERLFSPIGLSIRAETPAEIAISVAAEMIQFRANSTSD
jgi:xanthine dehydrogenase accessory factor